MANILVTGAHGTLGHVVCRVLSQRHRVIGTCRGPRGSYAALDCLLAPGLSLIDSVDLTDSRSLAERLPQGGISVVINCAGLIKQRPEANDPMAVMQVNALMPLRLAQWCEAHGARLIHLSTDCVFSGKRGGYGEDDTPDPVDLYGLSKLLGEVGTAPHLTLRTSFIGPQLSGQEGLLAWFLAQRGSIKGYAKAIFSGLTTTALAQVLEKIVDGPLPLAGLYHVAARPISKYALLVEIERRLRLGIAIERDDAMECDRSLDGHRFASASGIAVPDWDEMLDMLCAELDDEARHHPMHRTAGWAPGASP
jgi:dTDP-4-dehydrorhamnose reductase